MDTYGLESLHSLTGVSSSRELEMMGPNQIDMSDVITVEPTKSKGNGHNAANMPISELVEPAKQHHEDSYS